jgi:pimeloyl-ACP methyl ester carboxylesterase
VFVNGIEIALWEWPGSGPPVFFCHATGFHARIWDQVIARLQEDGADHRCFAFDARGHGQSGKPAPPYAWRDFGADVAALAESLGFAGAIGVGHSLGGHAVTLGAALYPPAFSALVLFDPVIRAQEAYVGPWGKTSFVAKRRNQWASAREMFERLEHRPPFDSWNRQVLRDYCGHALQPDGNGSLHLRWRYRGGIEYLPGDRRHSGSSACGARWTLSRSREPHGIVAHNAWIGGQLRARNGYLLSRALAFHSHGISGTGGKSRI